MPTIVLCIGPKNDPQLRQVAREIEALGGRAASIDSRANLLPLTWHASAPSTANLDGTEWVANAVYIRALPPRQPALRALASGESPRLEDFIDGAVDGNGRRDLVTAVAMDIEERGGVVLNPALHGSTLEHKPHQLRVAQRLGLPIPKTRAATHLPLSDDAGTRDDAGTWDDAGMIHKPIRGGGFAQRGLPHRARPFLVQEEIIGDDLRVVLVDHQVVAVYATRGLTTLDPRADPNWARGEFDYVAKNADDLPRGCVEKLKALTRQLALPLCGVDLKLTSTGAVFLEANGAPIWIEAEQRLGLKITSTVARLLVGSVRG